MVRWERRRPLVTSSLEALVGSYRSLMFIGVAFAESAAMMGFSGASITHKLWVYVVGMALGLFGLRWVAPTAADIERRQQQIATSGSPLSLMEAPAGPPALGREDQSP
jgi:hypothetical protein